MTGAESLMFGISKERNRLGLPVERTAYESRSYVIFFGVKLWIKRFLRLQALRKTRTPLEQKENCRRTSKALSGAIDGDRGIKSH